MTKLERRDTYYWNLTPETPLCINCKHFYRHYVWAQGKYTPIDSGHCAFPRLKLREAYDQCNECSRRDNQ